MDRLGERLKDAESCSRWLRLRLGTGKSWAEKEASVAEVLTAETLPMVRTSPLLCPHPTQPTHTLKSIWINSLRPDDTLKPTLTATA
jgi:hypothetical protein